MAEVYLAEQRSLQRRVAFKVLKPELASDDIYLKRFIREARAIAKLVHPNLVQIYQADNMDGVWFIAQEYVPGQTLQDLIKRGGPQSAKRVAGILWQVSSALDCAARAGIVHRDIKPDNILLGDNGDVKVADFGLARVDQSNETSTMSLTQVGMTLGTPLYMSPEQAQGKTLDHRSDMYSLGITCYHALTGQPPFRGDTPLAVALQHVNSQPEPLETLRPDLPPALIRIIDCMIEKDPDDRFQRFYDLQVDLKKLFTVFQHDEDTIAQLTGWNGFHLVETDEKLLLSTEKLRRVMQKERLIRKKTSRIWPFFLLLCLLLLLSGVVLGYWQGRSAPELLRNTAVVPVKKQATVEEQWIYACYLNIPDAWYAVIEYFPEEEYLWGRKAKRQLIRYYFHYGENGDSISPLPIFNEFAGLSDIDIEDQALGLAGLAWCATENNQGDMKRAWDYLRQLYQLPISFKDPLLMQILDATQETVYRKSKPLETEKN